MEDGGCTPGWYGLLYHFHGLDPLLPAAQATSKSSQPGWVIRPSARDWRTGTADLLGWQWGVWGRAWPLPGVGYHLRKQVVSS